MYFVICPANDLPALWAYRGLKQLGLSPLEIITPEALVYNRRLEHRMQEGETLTHLTLQDGRVFDSTVIRGVLNRINTLPLGHFDAADPADQVYAAQEQHAVFLSVLYGLPGVLINPPGPRGLGGDPRSPAEWAWLAGRAGLPVLPFHLGSDASDRDCRGRPVGELAARVIVLDGQIFGRSSDRKFSESWRASTIQLSKLSGLRLLGVDFASGPDDELCFASGSPLPDLRLGGDALLDGLAQAFA